jgi:hypothetical protein
MDSLGLKPSRGALRPLRLLSTLALCALSSAGALSGCSSDHSPIDPLFEAGGTTGGTGVSTGGTGGSKGGTGGGAGHAGTNTAGGGSGGHAGTDSGRGGSAGTSPSGGMSGNVGSVGGAGAGGTAGGGAGGGAGHGGTSSCGGVAPACRGLDSLGCCGNDPYGSAVCVNGEWMCSFTGNAPWIPAPGCNGQLCTFGSGGDAGGGAGGAAGQAGDTSSGQAGAL